MRRAGAALPGAVAPGGCQDFLLPADPVATASSNILFLFGFSCGTEYELLTHAHTHHLETETQLCALIST